MWCRNNINIQIATAVLAIQHAALKSPVDGEVIKRATEELENARNKVDKERER